MKMLFSKRHEDALKNKRLSPSFSKKLRTSLLRVLRDYSDMGGWNGGENYTFTNAEEALKTFYGMEELESFKEKARVPSNFEGVILNGYPTEVINAIEAWFDRDPQAGMRCEREINDCLAMNSSAWRFLSGNAILVDSEYIHQECRARTVELLRENNAVGALEEFGSAVQDLQSGETKDAIVKAHKSVESVMKTVLGVSDHQPFGKLLASLKKSSLIPNYYDDFLEHFEKLALGAVKSRNQPGTGHGQGLVPTDFSVTLAEFAVNLAGVINVFILKSWAESGRKPEKTSITTTAADDDCPF